MWSAELIDLGDHRLKDLGPPLQLLQVVVDGQDTVFPPVRSLDRARSTPPASEPRTDERLQVPLPAWMQITTGTPLTGRASELAVLRRTWTAARSGAERLVVLSGDAGIGKSRLAAELGASVADEGAAMLFGRCDDDVVSPYRPFAQALQPLVEHLPYHALSNHINEFGGALAHVVPSLLHRATEVEAPPGTGRELRPLVFDAVVDILRRSSRLAPLLLIIEDLHWADGSTTALFTHLIQTPLAEALLVLGTYRDTDIDDGHTLLRLLATLDRSPWSRHLALTELNQAGVDALLAATAGRPLDAAERRLSERIGAATSGNPLFVSEVLRDLTEAGALVRPLGAERPRPTSTAVIGVPESVHHLLRLRLQRVSSATRGAVQAAAVIGEGFDLPTLAAVLGRQEGELIDLIEEADRRGLLSEDRTKVDRYRFSHEIVRRALYEDLPKSRRIRLHARIGDALADRQPPLRWDRAHHLLQAAAVVAPSTLVDAVDAAAQDALKAHAWETAQSMAERAVAVAAEHFPERPDVRARLMALLAQALTNGGELRRARSLLTDAAALARQAQEPVLFAEIAARYVGAGMGWLDHRDTVGRDMVAEADEGLSADEWPAQAALLIARAQLELMSPDPTAVAVPAHQAVDVARRKAPERLGEALWMDCESRRGTADVDELLAAAQEGRAVDSPVRQTTFGYFEILGRINQGRFADIPALAADAIESGRRVRSELFVWYGHTALACLHTVHGRWDDAADALAVCRDLAEVIGDSGVGSTLHAEQFLAARRRDFAAVRRINDEMKERVPTFAFAPRDAVIGGLDGSLSAEQLRDVAIEWSSVVPLLPYWVKRGSTAWMSPVMRHAPPEVAAPLDGLYAPHDGLWISSGVHETQGSASWFRGALAEACGDLDAAVTHYERAVAAHDAVGEGPIRANYSVWLVETLVRRDAVDDRTRARLVAEDVAVLADRLGIPGLGDLALDASS